MISHTHGCIFVEVPKTGSTSIRDVLGHPPKAHLNLCQIRHELETSWTRYEGAGNRLLHALYTLVPVERRRRTGRRIFDEYFKFGFVRNPWDRMVSLYERREGRENRPPMTFPDFVRWARYASSTCEHPVPHRFQLDWFVDPSGVVLADFIGRFERLGEDWATVAGKLGLPPTLPHVNRNRRERHYTEYYTDETRDLVARRFHVDIEHFGYEFGA